MAVEIFAAGRLCLFGEHSDWAGEFRGSNPALLPGRTIVIGTQQGLYARAEKLDAQVLDLTSTNECGEIIGSIQIPLEPAALLAEARKGGFWSYAAGTAYRIMTNHHVGGLRINNYKTTLPMSKGLSSSAAICVMVARAFNEVYDLKFTLRGKMEYAYLGEIATPSKCGRMDQACAYGSVPVVMTFDADILHVDTIQLSVPLHIVLVDLCAAKDTTTILRDLQAAYPTAQDDKQQQLQELLGPINHNIVTRALTAMETGDLPALGSLMCEAQKEFDGRAGPMCPSQLTAPVLHKALTYPPLQPFIYGCKGVGSQGDGTAQFLCKGPEAQAMVCDIITKQLGMKALPLTVGGAE